MNVEAKIKTDKSIPIRSKTIIHLSLVQTKINETIHSALKPFDISLQQFNVLRILRGQKGVPANLNTINERMVTKMSNTTRLVDKLIIKDFVARQICPKNRRKVEIFITEIGLEALHEMDAVMTQTEHKLLEGFTENELTQLNELLHKL
jgi:DNA-binding MarR family transcriptional regulator